MDSIRSPMVVSLPHNVYLCVFSRKKNQLQCLMECGKGGVWAKTKKHQSLKRNISFLANLIPDGWHAPILGVILFLAVAYYLPDIIKKWLSLGALWRRGKAAREKS